MWSQQGGWTSGGWGRSAPGGGGGSTLLSLDFTGGSLPSGAAASGGANGSYINSSGIVAFSSAPRFDYLSGVSQGILVEVAATNLLQQSAGMSGAPWENVLSGANTDVSPDGTTTADSAAFGINAKISQYFSFPNGTYTASVWLKGSGNIILGVMTNGYALRGQLSIALTSTWTRYSVSGTTFGSDTLLGFQLTKTDSGTTTFAAWGAQLETGAVATTYVPTTSGTATRTADAIAITIPSGGSTLTATFDDNSTQNIGVAPGGYTLTTSLNRPRVKTLVVT